MNALLTLREQIKYAELFAAVIGFIQFRKMKLIGWQLLPVLLLLLAVLEWIGYFLALNNYYTENEELYKYAVIPYLFFFALYFYSRIGIRGAGKKIQLIAAGIFICSWCFESFFLGTDRYFLFSLSISVLSLFVIICSLLYYYSLRQGDELRHFYKSVSFWFCTGIFLFYLLCLPYYSMYNYLAVHYRENIFIPYTWVNVILNFIMYIFFSTGFIWGNRK